MVFVFSCCLVCRLLSLVVFFFFNDTATTEIYTLSLHDALPIGVASSMSPMSEVAVDSWWPPPDRKSTRLNSSHVAISYAVFCLKKKNNINITMRGIKSKNVYSRVNSKATTQWRKTESANGVHLEGVASDNRSS